MKQRTPKQVLRNCLRLIDSIKLLQERRSSARASAKVKANNKKHKRKKKKRNRKKGKRERK